jgi:hypothetical protein
MCFSIDHSTCHPEELVCDTSISSHLLFCIFMALDLIPQSSKLAGAKETKSG